MSKSKHEYFKELKKRMINNNYEEYAVKMQTAREKQYFINNKQLTREQLGMLTEKIDEIAASEEFIYDPLTRMIVDGDDFESLDTDGKIRYMLELSSLYLTLKNAQIK